MMPAMWWPGLFALATGVAFALAVLRATPRDTEDTDDEVLARHEHDLQLSLDQLRELSVEEHLFDPATYASEKARIEQTATAAMKARDTHRVQPAASRTSQPARAGFARQHPRLAGALFGAGVVGFAWLLSWQITSVTQPSQSAMATPSRYEALLVLSAIALEQGDAEQFLKSWVLYMRQPEPRRRPPQLQRATDWLEEHLKD